MPKGLSQTSAPLVISFSVNEAVVNTFAQAQIDVQLNVLDREILVVTGVDLDVLPPDGRAGTDTRVRGSIGDTNVIASARDDIRAADFLDSGVGFSTKFGETPAIGMDYLNIIATNNFFAQIEGAGNGGTKGMTGRLYCYRAVADAATFAALVQSELLSA